MAEKLLPVPDPFAGRPVVPDLAWKEELTVLLRYLSILAVTAINKIREEKK